MGGISQPKPGDETTGPHYRYDAWNRLTAVYEDDGDGLYEPGTDDPLLAEYEYDGINRRSEKEVSDAAVILRTRITTGVLQNRYLLTFYTHVLWGV